MSPRGPDKQFDRQEVLGKAMQAFWAHGYEGTGLTDLTHEMGIGRQSLYNTFGDKRALFLEALALYFQQGVEPVLTMLRSRGPAMDNIKKVFAYWEQMVGDPESCGCMIGNTVAEFGHDDEEINAIIERYVGRVEDAFHDVLVRGREEGTLEADVPERDLARLLITMSQGGALLSKTPRGRASARKVLDAVWRLLTHTER